MLINCGVGKLASHPRKRLVPFIAVLPISDKSVTRDLLSNFFLVYRSSPVIKHTNWAFLYQLHVLMLPSNLLQTLLYCKITPQMHVMLNKIDPCSPFPPQMPLNWRTLFRRHPASSDLKALPCRCTWLYLRLTCLPYVISKPLSAWSWMGTKERPPLMINCSKSPGFCIPMVPRLSGHHVTCSQHFSSRLGES